MFNDIVGNYKSRNNYLTIELKEDGSFFYKDNLKREISFGKWIYNGTEIKLISENPIHITDYFSSYKLITDFSKVLKLKNKDKLILNNKSLSKG
ncbi:hypothetical protein H9X57_11310 [Flavobacterium piscinae]|uniref:Uncharacterized protein n=1 Tax=Flavobacterium piscinae TaxID=2506424 RepID=A0A4Q1KTM9_9FLAO|nr:hypothetical protein [Flavobacterium piscinae]MBC8883737.1 hypothetical protein [Flavobacterium piscinae]RXR33531.1 hypothetical protein EQG68_04700 [Flavobacterium piscinae]